MATVQSNQFVEMEFTGTSNNEIFDTTNKEEAKKMGMESDVKPIIICVGNEMLLKSFDNDLVGKEIGKSYVLKLKPSDAFGPRKPSLMKTVPLKVFHEKQINPYPGLTLQMDNYLVKILSVSGGRVIVDFNNPLAGKDVEYNYLIKREVTDDNEKINAIQDFFFRVRFDFDIKDKTVIFKKPEIKPFIDIFGEKFEKMTGLKFTVEEKKEEKPVKENLATDKPKVNINTNSNQNNKSRI